MVVGAAATAIAAIHVAVTLVGPWLVLVPVGVVLLFLGRQRTRTAAAPRSGAAAALWSRHAVTRAPVPTPIG